MGRRRAIGTGACLLLLATALVAWGTTFVFPDDLAASKYSVKLRNAFLAQPATEADLNWVPSTRPADFEQENQPIPEPLAAGVAAIRATRLPGAGRWSQAIAIGQHLQTGRRTGGSVLSSTVNTYREIMENRRGYCADFTQVFDAIGYGLGLSVREWGMSFDGYGGDGHAFSEIYDPDLGDWVFIDSYWSFFVRDRKSGRPLSVLAFRDRLVRGDAADTVEVVPVKFGNFGLKTAERAFRYYGRGANQFYLWMANNPLTFDAHPVMRALAGQSRSVQQAVAILIGLHPTFRVVPSPTSAADLASLRMLRLMVIGVSAAFVLATTAGLTLVVIGLRRRPTPGARPASPGIPAGPSA